MNQGAQRSEKVGKETGVKATREVGNILHLPRGRKNTTKRIPVQREQILVPKGGNLVPRKNPVQSTKM